MKFTWNRIPAQHVTGHHVPGFPAQLELGLPAFTVVAFFFKGKKGMDRAFSLNIAWKNTTPMDEKEETQRASYTLYKMWQELTQPSGTGQHLELGLLYDFGKQIRRCGLLVLKNPLILLLLDLPHYKEDESAPSFFGNSCRIGKFLPPYHSWTDYVGSQCRGSRRWLPTHLATVVGLTASPEQRLREPTLIQLRRSPSAGVNSSDVLIPKKLAIWSFIGWPNKPNQKPKFELSNLIL